MPERKPTKPSQFTESFQFIQSLFQEEETKREKIGRLVARLFIWFKWTIAACLLLAMIALVTLFQIEAISLTEDGLWLPRR